MPIPEPGRGNAGRGYGRGRGGFAGVPVYIGGYYGDYGYGYGPGPGYGYDAPISAPAPAPAVAPPVIINQYFGAPNPDAPPVNQPASAEPANEGISYYQQPANTPPPSPDPPSYLLAFKDHSVYSVLAYWVEGNTVHYLTPQNVHNQADLSAVDAEMTAKINRDLHSPFSLKPNRATAPPSGE